MSPNPSKSENWELNAKCFYKEILHAETYRIPDVYGSCSLNGCGGTDGWREETASQPCRERAMQVRRRQVNQGGLLEPARQGPQSFWRTGALRAGVADRSERGDHVCER